MDIEATLQNCINALGGLRPRVDQPEIFRTAQMVINTLHEVKAEVNRMAQAGNTPAAEEGPQEGDGEKRPDGAGEPGDPDGDAKAEE